jgi:hypothetical protein
MTARTSPADNPLLAEIRHLERRAPWRAFAPVICLGCLGLAAVLLVGAWRPGLGTAIGAVFAASVSVAAAFVSYRLKQEDDARVEERRRIGEQMGLAGALISEIEDNKLGSDAVHSEATIAEVWQRMTADPAYLPFLVEDEGGGAVFGSVLDRLALLPYPVVRAVVRYYAADTTLNESIAAWRSADFRALCNPADPTSVEAGRPRQKRFVMWTLLSICDIYAVPLPDPVATSAAGQEEAFRTMVTDHLAERGARIARDAESAVPHADRALRELRGFVEECREALAFLDAQDHRRDRALEVR